MKNLKDYIIEAANEIPAEIEYILKRGIENGFIIDVEDKTKYGISKENIYNLKGWDFPKELLKKTVDKLIKDGVKFKFETDEEWKKAGYKDPNED